MQMRIFIEDEGRKVVSAILEGGQDLTQFWHESLFHRRIIQHNVRVASLYYRRIHGTRLAQLLGLEPERLESYIL